MPTRSGRRASQQPRELARLIEILQGVDSYLEIGARHGDTFYDICKAVKPSKAVAVDLPDGPWGTSLSLPHLKSCVSELGAHLVLGSSHDEETYLKIRELGPYDAVLIDGDHRYNAVKEDFMRYQCPITVFHDIAAEGIKLRDMEVGVPRFWNEIKDQYRHEEIIDPSDDRPMGIGVLYERRGATGITDT